MRRRASIALASLTLACCGGGDSDAASPDSDTTRSTSPTTVASTTTAPPRAAGATAAELCADAALAATDARVASPDLREISGIAVSRRHDGVVWAHNDSGADPEIFAIGDDGAHRGRFRVEGADAFDWEDISLGPGPDGQADHLYVADVGDNFGRQRGADNPLAIYRVPEPKVDPELAEGVTEPAAGFLLAYEDGPRDAETVMVDPLTGDLFVVSKQWDGAAAGVYRLPAAIARADTAPMEITTMARVADVADSADQLFTGGDIAAGGSLIALRTYAEVWLWDREPQRGVAETLTEPPICRTRVVEPQGEAVAFAPDGRGFLTISEGQHQPILWHRLPASPRS